jgi:hypothetical protein
METFCCLLMSYPSNNKKIKDYPHNRCFATIVSRLFLVAMQTLHRVLPYTMNSNCSPGLDRYIRYWAVRTMTTHLHSKHPVEERTGSRNANEIAPYHPMCNPLIAFYHPHPYRICILLTGNVWWYFIPTTYRISCCLLLKRGQARGGWNINSEVRMTDFIIWEVRVWEEETMETV